MFPTRIAMLAAFSWLSRCTIRADTALIGCCAVSHPFEAAESPPLRLFSISFYAQQLSTEKMFTHDFKAENFIPHFSISLLSKDPQQHHEPPL
jgi:hypothetical protein